MKKNLAGEQRGSDGSKPPPYKVGAFLRLPPGGRLSLKATGEG